MQQKLPNGVQLENYQMIYIVHCLIDGFQWFPQAHLAMQCWTFSNMEMSLTVYGIMDTTLDMHTLTKLVPTICKQLQVWCLVGLWVACGSSPALE